MGVAVRQYQVECLAKALHRPSIVAECIVRLSGDLQRMVRAISVMVSPRDHETFLGQQRRARKVTLGAGTIGHANEREGYTLYVAECTVQCEALAKEGA